MSTDEVTTRREVLETPAEDRDRLLNDALEWARRWFTDRTPSRPLDRRLVTALLLLDDGRRNAIQTLDRARARVVDWGPGQSVPDFTATLQAIDYAVARLSGAIERRLDPELWGSDDRAPLAARALDLADAALDGVSDGAWHAELTDFQCLAAAYLLSVERLLAASSPPRRTRCTWCVLAVGAATAAPLLETQVVEHAFECPHSPGAAAIRALLLAHRARASMSAVRAHVATGVVEIENRRLLATGGQVHGRDCPDPTSPHATCEEPTRLVADGENLTSHRQAVLQVANRPVDAGSTCPAALGVAGELHVHLPDAERCLCGATAVAPDGHRWEPLYSNAAVSECTSCGVQRLEDSWRPTSTDVAPWRGTKIPQCGARPSLGESHVTDVRRCARCGGDHARVEFHRLERPMAPAELKLRWTHWAPCPTNGQPILMGQS